MIAAGGRIPAFISASCGCCGRVHGVARAAKLHLHGTKDLRLVVDDEDPSVAHLAATARDVCGRQRECERRAGIRPRLDPEPTAVQLREAARNRKSQAGP